MPHTTLRLRTFAQQQRMDASGSGARASFAQVQASSQLSSRCILAARSLYSAYRMTRACRSNIMLSPGSIAARIFLSSTMSRCIGLSVSTKFITSGNAKAYCKSTPEDRKRLHSPARCSAQLQVRSFIIISPSCTSRKYMCGVQRMKMYAYYDAPRPQLRSVPLMVRYIIV